MSINDDNDTNSTFRISGYNIKNDGYDDGNNDVFVGVPTSPKDFYEIMLFFLVLYLVGDCFCGRVLKIVPSLVGYILVGIAFGPEGFDLLCVPCVETFVILGNLGLVLLIMQAGLEMDYDILKLVGPRGVIIAVVGTILPITIGTAIATLYIDDWKAALCAGCSFGPTSAGIAINVLGRSSSNNKNNNILNLPVGQLIVAAAIVDDILALVVLSQLKALTTKTTNGVTTDSNDDETAKATRKDAIIPIVSAVLWLVVGGYIALWIFPKILVKTVDLISSKYSCIKEANDRGNLSLVVLFALLYTLMVATYFSQASYLLGAFLSGLAFCRDRTGVDELFRNQFKRMIDWLMKIFFAASIGFQVPVRSFGDTTVISRGLLLALALTGKLAVGLLTPIFFDVDNSNDNGNGNDNDNSSVSPATTSIPSKRFRGKHLRDCVVVGFSMMGEAEFAFVVAVFGVSEGLVPPDIYASIVWAILLSTLISPLLLRTTLFFFPYTYADDDDVNDDANDSKQS